VTLWISFILSYVSSCIMFKTRCVRLRSR